jgi:hypothetical protein
MSKRVKMATIMIITSHVCVLLNRMSIDSIRNILDEYNYNVTSQDDNVRILSHLHMLSGVFQDLINFGYRNIARMLLNDDLLGICNTLDAINKRINMYLTTADDFESKVILRLRELQQIVTRKLFIIVGRKPL